MSIQFPTILAATTQSVTDATATAVSHSAGANPLVQLSENLGINMPMLMSQVFSFVVVALILYYFAFKPILSTLATRQQKITDGLQYAEEMRMKLTEAERLYVEKVREANKEAQELIEQARLDSKEYLEKHTQEAVKHAEEIIKKAQEAAVFEHKKMMGELRKDVASLVVTTTEKVLGRQLSENDRSLFTQSAAKEISSKN